MSWGTSWIIAKDPESECLFLVSVIYIPNHISAKRNARRMLSRYKKEWENISSPPKISFSTIVTSLKCTRNEFEDYISHPRKSWKWSIQWMKMKSAKRSKKKSKQKMYIDSIF